MTTGVIATTAVTIVIPSQNLSKKTLIICSDTYSKYIPKNDRTNRPIFSDGASAILIEMNDKESLKKFSFQTFGDGYRDLIVENNGQNEGKGIWYYSNGANDDGQLDTIIVHNVISQNNNNPREGAGAQIENNQHIEGSYVSIENCDFINNISESGDGGGLYLSSNTGVIKNCNFIGNSTTGAGSGLHAPNSTSNVRIINCVWPIIFFSETHDTVYDMIVIK